MSPELYTVGAGKFEQGPAGMWRVNRAAFEKVTKLDIPMYLCSRAPDYDEKCYRLPLYWSIPEKDAADASPMKINCTYKRAIKGHH